MYVFMYVCMYVCMSLQIRYDLRQCGPEKGNRKRGSKPYLFSCRAPNSKRDKLVVTFS